MAKGKAGASGGRAAPQAPTALDARLQQALAAHQQGRLELARAGYEEILRAQPQHCEALHLLGVLALQQKDAHKALALIGRVLEIRPDHAEAWSNLASAFMQLRRLDEALTSYERAVALKPDFGEAWYNRGNALREAGRLEETLASYERAIGLGVDLAAVWYNRGQVLKDLYRLGAALASYERALTLKPDYAEAYCNAGNVLIGCGRLTEAEASFRDALKLAPDSREARSNLVFALNYTDRLSRAEVFEEHLAWSRRHEAPLAAQRRAHANSREPQRRLRVGYVSPDFRSHSVAFFIEPLLARHDREAFEVYCYSNVLNPDRITQRLTAAADCTRSIAGMSDPRAAEQVRADGIDILVDLAGHTARGRLELFALKPAPVQVTYLGYPNTTGLAAIDWRVTDVHADPPGNGDAFHSERLARLPRTFLCFRPPEEAPAVALAPCLEKEYVTFGSFNARPKTTTEVIGAWARLMERVPGSRLLLKEPGLGDAMVRSHLLDAFAQHGIAGNRLVLLPRENGVANHLARYHEVDIALDPFPYNGATTTCEALWMGVPVVSLAGQRHAGRVGASILANLGLEELLAQDVEDYIARAARLAADGARLAALRATMRERVAASPLRDETGFVRALERAYRDMWRRWCGREA